MPRSRRPTGRGTLAGTSTRRGARARSPGGPRATLPRLPSRERTRAAHGRLTRFGAPPYARPQRRAGSQVQPEKRREPRPRQARPRRSAVRAHAFPLSARPPSATPRRRARPTLQGPLALLRRDRRERADRNSPDADGQCCARGEQAPGSRRAREQAWQRRGPPRRPHRASEPQPEQRPAAGRSTREPARGLARVPRSEAERPAQGESEPAPEPVRAAPRAPGEEEWRRAAEAG